MFIGHFGVALAAKKVAPRPSLGTLTFAALLVDGVWPVFLLLGWEKVEIKPGITAVSPLDFVSYPYTHSLVAGVFWGCAHSPARTISRAAIAAARCGSRRSCSRIGCSISSRTARTCRSDCMDRRWGSVCGTRYPRRSSSSSDFSRLGAWAYASVTRPRDRTGCWALWIYVATLGAIYAASVAGPPPPSVGAIEISGFLGWLFVGWAYWIDRHRAIVTA